MTAPDNKTEREKYIRIERVSEITGYSRGSIYQLVFHRKIPCYKPTNGRLFFLESEILEFLGGNRRATEREMSEMADDILNGSRRRK